MTSRQHEVFQKAMCGMQSHNKDAHDWLMKNPVGMWARHVFDKKAKSDHITNNLSESFNQWVNNYRDKPVLYITDAIRLKLMKRLQKRFKKGCTYKGKLTPRIKKKLEVVKNDARFCMPIYAGGDEFEVIDTNSKRFVVNLIKRTCVCGVWECSGVRSKHVASDILFKRYNLEDYCDEFYTLERYMQAYGEIIHPLLDLSTLSAHSPLYGAMQPPPLRRAHGRPHKNRRRELGEAAPSEFRKRGRTIRCDVCKEIGHNSRTCQKAAVKKKGQSSRKRKQKQALPNESNFSSQVETRSQSSAIVTEEISIQPKLRAKKAAKLERQKKRAKDALGQ